MADIDVDEVLSKLTLKEKVVLLAGDDFWHTKSLPEHGIPALRVSDGPNGVRGIKFFNGVPAACFPCGTALGATWDMSLLHEAGLAMGEECIAKGAHILLGPTVNIQRSPIGGRGFESFSEDPILSGLASASIINGLQKTGVVATLKHLVCNDMEHMRHAYDVRVTERALREIYLRPFQIAIKDANPGSIMTSYNKVNGIHASEHPQLLKNILRGEWGWKGLVMSDWYGTYSSGPAINAGLDLEMPGKTRCRGTTLNNALKSNLTSHYAIDCRVREVLNLVKRCAASGIPENAPETTRDTPETAALLRKIAGDSIVLLKNDNILPLSKNRKTLVVGPNAKIASYHGGGSASLLSYYAVTPFDGISARISPSSNVTYTVGSYAHKELPVIGKQLRTSTGEVGFTFKAFNTPPSDKTRMPVDELILTNSNMFLYDYKCPRLLSSTWYAEFEGVLTAEEDGEYELGVCVFGTAKIYVDGKLLIDNETTQRQGTFFFGMATLEERGIISTKAGQTYHIKIEFGSAPTSKLPSWTGLGGNGGIRFGGAPVINPEQEILRAANLAAAAEQVIVCAGLNADWEGEGADRADMSLPGYMSKLISAVSAANPKTVVVIQSGTPVEMPWLPSVPGVLQAWFGGNETGNAIADVVFGDVCPSGKLPLSFPLRLQDNPAYLNYRTERGRVLYGEDVYVGYRWYDTVERGVLFPFGHGLSYTSFEMSELNVSKTDETQEGMLVVTLNVKNTGSIAGAEVVQVYISQLKPGIRRPTKELKGFSKVALDPGAQKSVEIKVRIKDAAGWWDEDRHAWIVEKDTYQVMVGNSSALDDITTLKGEFSIKKSWWWNGL